MTWILLVIGLGEVGPRVPGGAVWSPSIESVSYVKTFNTKEECERVGKEIIEPYRANFRCIEERK